MPKINLTDLDINSDEGEMKPTKKEKTVPKKMKSGADNKPKQIKKK